MANISEGFGRYSFKDSKQFFTVARGSIAEAQSHLYVMLDRKLISKGDFEEVYHQAVNVNKLVNGLIRNVQYQITKDPVVL